MGQGSRSDRVADQLRSELGQLLAREVHDPGVGFVTLTRVQVSGDLQLARVFYTVLGDDTACKGARKSERGGFEKSICGQPRAVTSGSASVPRGSLEHDHS